MYKWGSHDESQTSIRDEAPRLACVSDKLRIADTGPYEGCTNVALRIPMLAVPRWPSEWRNQPFDANLRVRQLLMLV